MKILVLGDIHGRLCWLDIIKRENPDLTVFLGDYVSTHDDISSEQQCMNLEDILNHKAENPDKVILLRGNHDLQHLGYYWAECSGLFRGVLNWLAEPHMKQRFLDLTQWIYIYDNIVFSHAGISETWWSNVKEKHPEVIDLEDINKLEPSETFAFTADHPFGDYYGTSKTQPCTWIRPQTLARDCIKNYTQVVGHTRPVKMVDAWKEVKYHNHLWLCDCLPNEYLVIEDNNFIVKKF